MELALPKHLLSSLRPAGLTVLQPFKLDWYNSNAKVIQAGRCILPAGTAGASTLAFVIGATRELWEPFLSFCCQHPGFEQQDNPLDEYVMRHVTHAVQHDSTEAAKWPRIIWVHSETDQVEGSEPKYIAAQRLAAASGLSHLDESVHLSLHPVYGAWHSLRAVLVYDNLSYDEPRPSPVECHIDALAYAAAAAKFQEALAAPPGPTDAELAQNASLSAGDSWRIWVAVRDAIQPEHPWRYGDDQIVYHYRKDKAHLAACVRALRGAE